MTASTLRMKSINVTARNAAPTSDKISGSGRPVRRAIERATGLATSLVQPVRPTWPIATKFHFDI